ncbi:hypothetical protein A8F94_06670 [Bacillus sp. FJAT-27225]|uniref:hypothetical protein n=1 Tax=Bacillus sp. FJAT-27225 TaxID=1743144 RepID=UPI00080C2F8A|nr:hypothetical protein [Bacillus sp. FJAT-27225]OCA87542.1 hypothetical protein A8F94_06670 [Bacillus sp. FJAT-27225]
MKKRIWASLVALVVLALTAGGYAAYGMNKDKKAEKSVEEAKASATELYNEMKKRILEGEESGKFEKIDGEKVLQAEALAVVARTDVQKASKEAIRKYGEILAETVSPKINEVKEYNKGAEVAIVLYERINKAEKMAAENPLSPELISGLPNLMETAKQENERFKQLKDPYSSLFADRYIEKVEKLEKILNLFLTADQAVQTVFDMSTNSRIDKADFDNKVEEARKRINELTNQSVKGNLTSKLEGATKAFGSMDAKRKAAEAEQKEELAKEIEKAEEPKIFTAPDGTNLLLGEKSVTNPDWKVAQKHGAGVYYLPGSDVGMIVKNNKSLLTFSSGTMATETSQAALLADLLTARGFSVTQKEVENVVKSGSPFEKEADYFRVYREGTKLFAETW